MTDDSGTSLPKKSKYDIITEYAGYASIQGLNYIFFEYQTWFGKAFWIIAVLFMSALGLYWSIETYNSWDKSPVLTTITTTALPVQRIDFPTVTFCSSGTNDMIMTAAIIEGLFNYNSTYTETPIELAYSVLKLQDKNIPNVKNQYDQIDVSKLPSLFMSEKLPGFHSSDTSEINTLLKLLSSANPDVVLLNEVAKNNSCENGFVKVSNTYYDICYKANFPSKHLNLQESKKDCGSTSALLYFENDQQVYNLLSLIKEGALFPIGDQYTFFVNVMRRNGIFFIDDGMTDARSMKSLVVGQDTDKSLLCVTTSLSSSSSSIILTPANCSASIANATICMNTLSVFVTLLYPDQSENKIAKFDESKKLYQGLFNKMKTFETLFPLLWYNTLPCFDIKGVTSLDENTAGILKYCEWKGVTVPCAAIFDTFPTDRGMCCSFNMRKADEVFNGETYSKLVITLQEKDKARSFVKNLEDIGLKDGEPKTLSGRNNGLIVMLDAYSNIISPATIDTDFQGFMGMISTPGEFPFTAYGGFAISPGVITEVLLSSTKVDADEGLKSLTPIDRGCRFPDEIDGLVIHKNYSQTNCMFECALFYSYENLDRNCTPWYFPSAEKSISVCDPWQNVQFQYYMSTNFSEDLCSECLPDCSTTMYQKTVISAPFRACEAPNFGVSFFCNLNNIDVIPTPQLFADLVLPQFPTNPEYIANIVSQTRYYPNFNISNELGHESRKSYDAYENDIALVKIFFDSTTAIQIGTQATMTWVDFWANIGGLLGLVLGMGIISVIELIWLALRLMANSTKFEKWIP